MVAVTSSSKAIALHWPINYNNDGIETEKSTMAERMIAWFC